MRKMFGKHMMLAAAAAIAVTICGCGAENEVGKQEDVQTEAETVHDGETPETYGIFNYDYTGYQDECTGWSGYTSFVGQDYDNDGRTDRVYKEYSEDTDANSYRIEFGNGDVIAMDCKVAGTAFLDIKSADINNDGKNEIILSFLYGASTDMRGAGGMEVYEKRGDGYEKAILPFQEIDGDCSQSVSVRYQTVRDRLIQVSVEDGMYETLVPISSAQWDSLDYDMYFGDAVENRVVWDNYILEKDGKTQLVCKVHLFDKWSDCGLFAVLDYQDGKYVIDRWMRTNEEFSEEAIEEDSCWGVEDYLLCSRMMETGGRMVGVGLWLESGTYGSMEEFVPGGGVYEENFMGQYYLLVTDEEGNTLSKRYIAQDFCDADWLNFPGAFEIIAEDYNQDSCPDFAIGTYGSSSVNIYTLYTIWQDGQIDVIGKDIPKCGGGFSTAFEGDGDKTIYGSIYDNSVGEISQTAYRWDDAQKEFLERNAE